MAADVAGDRLLVMRRSCFDGGEEGIGQRLGPLPVSNPVEVVGLHGVLPHHDDTQAVRRPALLIHERADRSDLAAPQEQLGQVVVSALDLLDVVQVQSKGEALLEHVDF